MAKTTPGPWHWHCSRTLMHLHDANGSCFAEVSMRRSLMHEADANLIAAAPELFARLEQVLPYLSKMAAEGVNTCKPVQMMIDQVETALAHARGEVQS